MSAYRLTDAGLRILRNAINGRPLEHGIEGMAAHGGHGAAVMALRRAGLLSADGSITEAGRVAVISAVVDASRRPYAR